MGQKRIFTKMQRDEIRRNLNKVQKRMRDIKSYRRLQALRMYALGISNREIAQATEFSIQNITRLVTIYLTEGIDAILMDKRTSNNRRMSFEQETEFLNQFLEMAEAGQLITVKVILKKYEETTGKPSNTSAIYKLLKRHGWRKVQPRPHHPGKASEEEISSSKKLTLASEKWCWKYLEETDETNIDNTKV